MLIPFIRSHKNEDAQIFILLKFICLIKLHNKAENRSKNPLLQLRPNVSNHSWLLKSLSHMYRLTWKDRKTIMHEVVVVFQPLRAEEPKTTFCAKGSPQWSSLRKFTVDFKTAHHSLSRKKTQRFFFRLGNVWDKQLNKSQLVTDALGAHVHVVFFSWQGGTGRTHVRWRKKKMCRFWIKLAWYQKLFYLFGFFLSNLPQWTWNEGNQMCVV